MEIRRRTLKHGTVIWLDGRLDAATVHLLRNEWSTAENEKHFALDMSGVTFIDSLGLAALVSGLKLARQRGGDVVLVNPSDRVRTILELTVMDKVFRIVATVSEALGSSEND